MRVLVTGATGQIGSGVAEALVTRSDYVRCLVRDAANPGLVEGLAVELVEGDVTVPDSLASAVNGMDAVAHVAGKVSYWHRMKTELRRVNVDGTRNLLNAAAEAGVRRFLYTSSIATLGYRDEISNETTPYNWDGMNIDYFDTKFAAERLVIQETRLEGLAVNPGIVFGQKDVHMHAGRMLFQVWQGNIFGIPPGITTVAVLNDVIAGHVAALDRGRPGERYILGGTILSFSELFARIAAVLGRPAPTRVLSRRQLMLISSIMRLRSIFTGIEPIVTSALVEIFTRNRRHSSQKAMDELDYRPSSIEDGIKACRQWYIEHGLVSTYEGK